MRAPRTLSDEEIVALYASGTDSDSIGFRAGCSGTTVLKIVRDAGEPIRAAGGRPAVKLLLTDQQIIDRYNAGESGTKLGAAAQCVPSTIYRILRSAGIHPRPRTNKRRGGKFAS